MISQDKVHVYKKYWGDVDKWARNGSPFEKSIMGDDDWYQIVEMLWGISMIKSGSAHPTLVDEVKKKMREQVENDEVRKLLFEIA